MPYTIKPGMVEANEDLLTRIDKAMREGEPLVYHCSPHMLSKVQYQLHNLLKATEVLTSEAGGRFATLRGRTRLSSSTEGIVFQPKATPVYLTAQATAPTKPDERAALSALDESKSNGLALSFLPSTSFDIDQFNAVVERKGWRLLLNKQTGEVACHENEDGTVMYMAERAEQSRPDVYKKFGY